jgi:excisionase family DNA binding protein
MKDIYTTYQVARMCDVDITTVINWIDTGKLTAYKTPGGHRRIRRDDFVKFLRAYNLPIPWRVLRGGSQTILIINDDDALQEKITNIVKDKWPDITVLTAEDAFAAGKLLAEKRPTLVILTKKLPGIDCSQVCQMIRSDRRLKQTKIMAIIDVHTAQARADIIRSEVDEYISGTFSPEELVKHAEKILS